MTVFDDDLAQATSALNDAQAAFAGASRQLGESQSARTAQQAIAADLNARLPELRTALAQALDGVGSAQTNVVVLTAQVDELAQAEPLATLQQPNPAYADWQANRPGLKQVWDEALVRVTDAQQAVAEAQAAVDEHDRNEPDTTDGRWGKWHQTMVRLQAALATAQSNEAAARQAATDAQAAYENGPPPTIAVANPAHATWRNQMDQLQPQLDQAQAALAAIKDAATALQQALDVALAVLQQDRADLLSINANIASKQAQVSDSQRAVDQAQSELSAAQAALGQANAAATDAKAEVDRQAAALQQLSQQEPAPTVQQTNPDYVDWQANRPALKQGWDEALARVTDAQQAVADAQAAVDEHDRNEPDTTDGRWGKWHQTMLRLQAALATAQSNEAAARQAATDAQAAYENGPPPTISAPNPAHQTWRQQMDQQTAALSQAQVSQANATATAGQAVTAVNVSARRLQDARGALQALNEGVANLQARAADLQRQIDTDLAEVTRLQAALKQALAPLDTAQAAVVRQTALVNESVRQEPAATVQQPNPAYAGWQANRPALKQGWDEALARVTDAQQAVADAQAAVDEHDRNEPDTTDGRWGKWHQTMVRLQAALATAQNNEAAARQAATDAQAAYENGPSPTVEVDNPAHISWRTKLDQLIADLGNAQAALTTHVAQAVEAQRAVYRDEAQLQAAQAQMQLLDVVIAFTQARITAMQSELIKLRARLDQVRRWIAVLDGTPSDRSTIIEVVTELTGRLTMARDLAAATAQAAQEADDAALWLTHRVDELTRLKPIAEADLKTFADAQRKADAASLQVEAKLENMPW